MTRDHGSSAFSRRRVLRGLGTAGFAGLAGCAGGDNSSEPEETTTVADTSTPVRTTESNPYELPESEHVEPDDVVLGWLLVPPGPTLAATAYSPSQASERYGTTYAEVFHLDGLYDVFDFHDDDIPETFLQEKDNNWSSVMKVDQLPDGITEDTVVQQLLEGGYYKDAEIGEFEIYRSGDGGPRAVGQGRHIVSHPIATGDDESAMEYMDNFLSQRVEGDIRPGGDITRVVDVLHVHDSVTLRMEDITSLVKGVKESRQPEIGAASVNMETGDKSGAWVFEDERTAGNVHAIKQAEDLLGHFENINQDGKVITAQGNYHADGMGYKRAQVSAPIL